MNNISLVIEHLRGKIAKLGGNPDRETLSIVPTINDGKLFYKLIENQDSENSQYWTMFKFIENTTTHEKADSEELAFEGGKMIGKFQNMLSDLVSESHGNITYENRECIIKDVLPGFHNIKFRFEQFDQAIERNIVNRLEEVKDEIGIVENYRKEMIDFWELVESNKIPLRITHNDTKLSNILFDTETNKACCLIDLDTVMCSTVLNDFGDAIRSYCNTSTEDDPNTQNIHLKMDIFESFTNGYLSEGYKFLTDIEIEYLAFSAKYITFEQALRFLTDYINGDTYYKTTYPQHNLIRTRAQLALLHSIQMNFQSMNEKVLDHHQHHKTHHNRD
ncbi:predicted protein [Naegleria gruberi]|uniref:Predicted protein n=1 Tax=Naegleria gruberi TaxID=5762 RepID=D2V5E3_NAEGR|nr:uncharacterized protein NAEGRDRAFT_63792 [Naegleria gruberi]EFC48097.1 predicted protein [Naegleria gruberi]|eukprot:XP_002680841.1 predicted protein [Naegleria gruberi strain NEG-M]